MTETKKIAVILGGMGYVGSAIALRLAKDGLTIALLYHTASENDANEAVSHLFGSGHKAYKCDACDTTLTNRVIAKIENDMGHIYVAIDAAGVIPKPKQLSASSIEDVREQFETGVFGSFNFLSACALRLKEHREGVIIGITTAAVITNRNTKARGAYSMVKYAIQGLLVAFKEELSVYNIRVYSVAPGVMAGGLNKATPKAFLDIIREKSPTKTLTDNKEVADKVAFLCSDDSRDTTTLTFLVAPESTT
jgi:3-oxoacyl-[acyl-carrier protein] reductase